MPEPNRLKRFSGHIEQGKRIAGPVPPLGNCRRLASAMNAQRETKRVGQFLDRCSARRQEGNDPGPAQRLRQRADQRETISGDCLHVTQHAARIRLGKKGDETRIVARVP